MDRLILPRALLALLVVSVVGTAAVVLVGLAAGPEAAPRPAAASDERDPLAALHAWDRRRARAWARGDLAALRRLYVPGSRAGRRDLAMLAAWDRRGLRVHGMRMQVLAADVRARSSRRLVVVVTDRLADAVAVGPGTRVPLPRDAASTRTVVLRRPDGMGRWRVSAVRERGQPAR
ncbi:hypothetical protein [Nocardioides ungokensis]|uniref:hypothetical protein n=1 Tax=Nocardioides ungokensis TaxID=1643322 RepID=UPI0015DE0ADC|nr:hypothetical protein [Nocardioides ungokensis]